MSSKTPLMFIESYTLGEVGLSGMELSHIAPCKHRRGPIPPRRQQHNLATVWSGGFHVRHGVTHHNSSASPEPGHVTLSFPHHHEMSSAMDMCCRESSKHTTYIDTVEPGSVQLDCVDSSLSGVALERIWVTAARLPSSMRLPQL